MKNPLYRVYPSSLVLNLSLASHEKRRFTPNERREFLRLLNEYERKWTGILGHKPPPNLMKGLRGAAARVAKHPEVHETRYGQLLLQKKEAKARKRKLDAWPADAGLKPWEKASQVHSRNVKARKERMERRKLYGDAADKGDQQRVLEGI